jgi:hypothetical protein
MYWKPPAALMTTPRGLLCSPRGLLCDHRKRCRELAVKMAANTEAFSDWNQIKNTFHPLQTCVLDILDTAGQEEYSSIRDQYVRQGGGFLIVYDITSPATFQDAGDIYAWACRVKNMQSIPAVSTPPKAYRLSLQSTPVVSTPPIGLLSLQSIPAVSTPPTSLQSIPAVSTPLIDLQSIPAVSTPPIGL